MNKYNNERNPSLFASSKAFSDSRSPRSAKNLNVAPIIKNDEYKTMSNHNANNKSNIMRRNLLKELDLKENQLLSQFSKQRTEKKKIVRETKDSKTKNTMMGRKHGSKSLSKFAKKAQPNISKKEIDKELVKTTKQLTKKFTKSINERINDVLSKTFPSNMKNNAGVMFTMEKEISKIKEEVNNRENSARKLEYEVNSLKYTMDNIAMNESKIWVNESKIKYDYSRVSNPKDSQKINMLTEQANVLSQLNKEKENKLRIYKQKSDSMSTLLQKNGQIVHELTHEQKQSKNNIDEQKTKLENVEKKIERVNSYQNKCY